MRRTVSALMIMLLLVGVSMLSFNVQRAKAEPNTIVVPDDFPTVQEAINAANHGDTIFIRSGNYHENIVVNKSLSLIGENRQHTVLNGSGSGTALDITANNVNVTNLTIQNIGDPSAVGIRLRNVKHCNISGNNIVNSAWGMNHYYSSYNIISKNNIKDNGFGMELEHSNCTAIYENCITENAIGVWLEESVHNIIFLNSVINSSSWGVFLGFSSRNNTISRNILALNRDHAIHLMDSSNNNIVGNNITENKNYSEAIIKMITKENMSKTYLFYAHIIAQCVITSNKSIPTAGVKFNNNKYLSTLGKAQGYISNKMFLIKNS